MQITGRGLELGVTEQHLDGAQVDTVIQQVCRKVSFRQACVNADSILAVVQKQ
jgi:hypothetical protein